MFWHHIINCTDISVNSKTQIKLIWKIPPLFYVLNNIPSWLSSEFLEDSEDANGTMDISDIGSSIRYSGKVPNVHPGFWG